jgi:hypothetical protein
MREAIGSSLIIKIMLIFITIYISFLALSVNYSSAFNNKNVILKIIEECEGFDNNTCAETALSSRLPNIRCTSDKVNNSCYVETIATDRGPYYKVTTYIKIEFPLVNRVTNFPITGETKVIYHGK